MLDALKGVLAYVNGPRVSCIFSVVIVAYANKRCVVVKYLSSGLCWLLNLRGGVCNCNVIVVYCSKPEHIVLFFQIVHIKRKYLIRI